jgi:hypothetical protein
MSYAPEQRAQIKQRAIEFGYPKDIAFRISMNVTNSDVEDLVSISLASDFLSCAFSWESSPEGYKFWEKIYFEAKERESFVSVTQKVKKELTQGETQQLLHFLRQDLDITSFHKSMHKEDAASLWQDCDKENPDDPFVSKAFQNFSDSNRMLRFYTKREKSLVSIISKLKGMK